MKSKFSLKTAGILSVLFVLLFSNILNVLPGALGSNLVSADDTVGSVCASGYHTGTDGHGCIKNTTATTTPASTSTTNSTAGSDSTDQENLTCSTWTQSPLAWIICPFVNLMSDFINEIDNLITQQLTIQTSTIFCTKGTNLDVCEAYHDAWESFRNIALGLMVMAGLIILISQALGMEVLDAYTIRKTLPRLLIAAIGITLSWPLMQFFVGFTNDLGFGVRALIYAPFSHLSNSIDLNFSHGVLNQLFGGLAAGGAVVAAVPAWIAGGGLGVVLSYFATAALAVFIAIIVLILRQIVVTFLIILAPIAIVAYILPHTERIYKLWWESFSKALLMFPLISGFIAAGRVFSAISLSQGGVLNGFIGFGAYFAPYFLIPATFKMAGGALRQIGGFVNDRSRGGFDRLRNYRANQASQRVTRARNKGLYREGFGQFTNPITGKKTSLGNVLNTIGTYSLDADEAVPLKLGTTKAGRLLPGGKDGIPGFRRGGERGMALIDQARRDQTGKALSEVNPGYKGGRLLAGEFGYYEDAVTNAEDKEALNKYRIGSFVDEHGDTKGVYRAPVGYGERQQIAGIFSRSGDLEAQEAGEELGAAAGLLEKYPMSSETSRVDGRLLGLMASAREGRLNIDDITRNHNALRAQGVGASQAIQETKMLQELISQKRTSAARGHGIAYDSQGMAHNVYRPADITDETGARVHLGPDSAKAQSSIMRMGTSDLSQVKSEDIDTLADTFVAGGQYVTTVDGNGHAEIALDASGNKIAKTNPRDLERGKQLEQRLQTIAMYNSGDSDVGAKVKAVWKRMGRDEADLLWESRGRPSGGERERFAPGAGDPHDGAPGPGAPGAPGGG